MVKDKLQDCFAVRKYCNDNSIETRFSFKIYNSYYKANLKYRIDSTVIKINILTNNLYIREKNCYRFIKCDINKITRYLPPFALPTFIRKLYHV